MKRIYIQDMPWEKYQEAYDNGMSLRELIDEYKLCWKTTAKAIRLSLLSTRDLSTARKIALQRKPRDYSEARSSRSDLANYRADCAFKFNLSDYPTEFDFTLIESYGWYKPTNKGNNLIGISRDHAVSIRYGFDHSLPTVHLAHPAKTILMQHSKNVSKGKKISLSYEELLERIEAWDKKYGELS